MKLSIDVLTIEDVHELIDRGFFPFALCDRCGPTPVSVNYDGRWTVTCPQCEMTVPASATSWRDSEGSKEAGWDLTPATASEGPEFDVRRRQGVLQ